jgi:hypothetical protein
MRRRRRMRVNERIDLSACCESPCLHDALAGDKRCRRRTHQAMKSAVRVGAWDGSGVRARLRCEYQGYGDAYGHWRVPRPTVLAAQLTR